MNSIDIYKKILFKNGWIMYNNGFVSHLMQQHISKYSVFLSIIGNRLRWQTAERSLTYLCLKWMRWSNIDLSFCKCTFFRWSLHSVSLKYFLKNIHELLCFLWFIKCALLLGQAWAYIVRYFFNFKNWYYKLIFTEKILKIRIWKKYMVISGNLFIFQIIIAWRLTQRK